MSQQPRDTVIRPSLKPLRIFLRQVLHARVQKFANRGGHLALFPGGHLKIVTPRYRAVAFSIPVNAKLANVVLNGLRRRQHHVTVAMLVRLDGLKTLDLLMPVRGFGDANRTRLFTLASYTPQAAARFKFALPAGRFLVFARLALKIPQARHAPWLKSPRKPGRRGAWAVPARR